MENTRTPGLITLLLPAFILGICLGFQPSADSKALKKSKPKTSKQYLLSLPISELNELMLDLVSEEEYEKAALIRDLIKEKNQVN